MSHVSENALDFDRECADIRLAFQDQSGLSKQNQLSEIAAYYILGSPAFLDLLRLADERGVNDFPVPEAANTASEKMVAYQDMMQNLVIGKRIDDDFPLLHELISGPFDADKLDYMPRDAHMCGVPVVTDVTRLIRKVRVVQVAREDLPMEIGRAHIQVRNVYNVTGIARSGARTLDELALGRALMFDKIYRHQKVRAAESMVASLVNELLQIKPTQSAMLPFRLVDEDLYSLSLANARSVLGLSADISPHSSQFGHLAVALDLAARLRDRNLLVRGFAFSSKMPMDPYRNDPEQRAGIEQLSRLSKNPRERSEFVKELAQLTAEVAVASGQPMPAQVVPGGNIEPYIWISAPIVADGSGEANQIGHAWLIGEPGEAIRRADQDYAETRGWSDAYVATRDLGLIFCPQEIAPALFLAAERLVRTRFGVRIPRSMRAFAKQDSERVRHIQEALRVSGWYEGLPRDLTPEPAILQRADAGTRLQGILDNLSGYSGPLILDPETRKVREPSLTKERIRLWLRQFPEELVDPALDMLSGLQFIGRGEVNATLDDFLRNGLEFHEGSVTPLGAPKDSSSVVTYYAGETARQYGSAIRGLEEALLHPGPIVMVDDYVGRGSATISIFEDYFAAAPSQALNQERSLALSPQAQSLLKRKKVALLYVAGKDEGAAAVRSRLEELGMEDLTVRVSNTHLPRLTDASLIASAQLRNRLIDYCRERGLEALEAGGTETERAGERALGYGNDALLLLSSYNTPTAALTCLWLDGPNWSCLFPRRAKQ